VTVPYFRRFAPNACERVGRAELLRG
jgi:hypothetical protein